MPNQTMTVDGYLTKIKEVIRRDLKLGPDEPIDDDMPLVGGEFDLDSLDILMLVTSMEKEFGVKIDSESMGQEIFATVGTLAAYVHDHASAHPAMGGPEPDAAPLEDVLARLPHRDPFRFISELGELERGQSGRAIWRLTGDEAYFAGHFPGRPIVPGVLIAEALAQLSGLVGTNDTPPDKPALLAKTEVTFRKPVIPPQTIELTSRFSRSSGMLTMYEVQATVGGQTVADGVISLASTSTAP